MHVIFLKHYRTSYRKDEFDVFENAYHVYSALDSLIFPVTRAVSIVPVISLNKMTMVRMNHGHFV
jgi:hypothetical protein